MKSIPLLSAFLLSACTTLQAQPDVAALITNPSAESRADLQSAVTAALNVASITLADDALTQTSILIIDRTRPRDAGGRQLSGRDVGKPEQFQLVKQGARCVLVHQASGKRFDLPKTTCKPA